MYDYQEEYDEYDDDEFEYIEPDDDWFDEWEVYPVVGGRFSSVSSLMPVIAIVVSMGMLLVFLRFVFEQMPDVDLSSVVSQTNFSATSTGNIAPLFTPSVKYWEADIVTWAKKWELDPNLVATVMQIESCGDPKALSSAGAMGLFQVMPFHFKNSEDPYHPNTNALRGMGYLSSSLDSFNGNIKMGLAGYNAGIGGASRGEALWPSETVRYTKWGVGIYEDAVAGKNGSETLNNWLAIGGKNLCTTAEKKLGIAP